MKKILIVCLSLFITQAFGSVKIEQINYYLFEFLNWSIATQVVPLSNGGYIVQKYGRIVTLFDAQGNMIKELEIGRMSPLYQYGKQVDESKVIFMNQAGIATFYDLNLNKINEYELPGEYFYAPCSLENGTLVYYSNVEKAVSFVNKKGKIETIGDIGESIRDVHCLKNNRVLSMWEGSEMLILEDKGQRPEIIFQKQFQVIENSLKVMGENKINFMTPEGLNILDLSNFKHEVFANSDMQEFTGVDYFSNGNYVTIEAFKDTPEQKRYHSIINLYSKEGDLLASTRQDETGASANMPIQIINDTHIVTTHCGDDVLLYDHQLVEQDRFRAKQWLCDRATLLTSGDLVFDGFGDNAYAVYQLRLLGPI